MVRYKAFEVGYKTALKLVIPNLFTDTVVNIGASLLPKEQKMFEEYDCLTVEDKETVRAVISKIKNDRIKAIKTGTEE